MAQAQLQVPVRLQAPEQQVLPPGLSEAQHRVCDQRSLKLQLCHCWT